MVFAELGDKFSTRLARLSHTSQEASSPLPELDTDTEVIKALIHALEGYARKYRVVFDSNNGRVESNGHIVIDTSQVDSSSTDYFGDAERVPVIDSSWVK